jgi:hypothetical protein
LPRTSPRAPSRTSPRARSRTSPRHCALAGGDFATRIIGEGSYGCVAAPALPCTGQSEAAVAGLISKTLEDGEAHKEVLEGARLSQIDTLVSPPDTAGTLSARYRFGVYALGACPASSVPVYQHAWEAATLVHASTHGDSSCGDAARTTLVHMEAAQGDLTVLSTADADALARVAAPWLRALKNALLALVNMHRHGFFHFDAKPANILWFGTWEAPRTTKLADFGSAVHARDVELRAAKALNFPWFNFPPSASAANALMTRLKTAASKAPGGRAATLSQRAEKQRRDDKPGLEKTRQAAAYWKQKQRSSGGALPKQGSRALTLVQLRLKELADRGVPHARVQAQAQAQAQAPAHSVREAADEGDGAWAIPPWADPTPFTLEGIGAHAQTAAERLSVAELCAACDVFGFALALVPFHAAFATRGHDAAAALVEAFFNQAAAIKLSDSAALRALDALIAQASGKKE